MARFTRNLMRRPAVLAAVLALVAVTSAGVSAARSPEVYRHIFVTVWPWATHAPSPGAKATALHTPAPVHTGTVRMAAPAAPPPSSSPCDVHITKTDPNSRTVVNCTSNHSGSSSSTTTSNNVEVNNSSTQSSNGGTNESHSSTTVNISN